MPLARPATLTRPRSSSNIPTRADSGFADFDLLVTGNRSSSDTLPFSITRIHAQNCLMRTESAPSVFPPLS